MRHSPWPRMEFQSTLPVWGATEYTAGGSVQGGFQSTLPVWGATGGTGRKHYTISNISIHAPRVGSDAAPAADLFDPYIFQSTLPVWGATVNMLARMTAEEVISIHAPRVGSDTSIKIRASTDDRHFNPRSPCGERRDTPQGGITGLNISIHAPRVGSDAAFLCKFLGVLISIHAPRVGSDHLRRSAAALSTNFNPRSPCGERRNDPELRPLEPIISIHAPRVGSDVSQQD